ncbi:hypothetical protein [Parablautia sp. Marseille-Q6255]|uniref:hypothetical protein n=1 Tax=Parablautia sp. Marseille-Q6255 TaxID=3039593 RepID=UPI0024BCE257|nr:hypothetical protein [Parablautia sp. Marseille-Q6255]
MGRTRKKKSAVVQTPIYRTYKSRIFEMIFSDRKELLSLYNAVNHTDYKDPEQLKVNTLKNAIYMGMRNDVSFIVDLKLNLYEHQSTYNPNLPLRFLFYVADLYSDLTKDANLYSTRLIGLPTPRFLVFYNGVEERPDKEVLKLSTAFQVKEEEVFLELTVIVLNINQGHNRSLLQACRTLNDYAVYTSRIRTYAQQTDLDTAVERAITECMDEGILADFLRKNRAEVKKVSIYEYDYEKHMRQEREENFEAGLAQGRAEGREEGLAEGICAYICLARSQGMSEELLRRELQSQFSVSEQMIKECLGRMDGKSKQGEQNE